MNCKEFLIKNQKIKVEEFENSVSSNPKVSVLIQTYNHKEFIEKCIDGVLHQKTNFDYEIILGEDESNDGTREICKQYAQNYPDKIRLFLHHRENNFKINKKPSGRFVKIHSIFHAKAKYIALCDGDDYWTDPCKLQKQVDFLERNSDFSMCVHNAWIENHSDGTKKLFREKKLKETLRVRDIILIPWFSPTASFLFRRENFIFPNWDNVNGDMQILFVNATLGLIHYDSTPMSVYNLFTSGSMSSERKTDYKNMLGKKMSLLNEFNKYTRYNYIVYITIKKVGVFLKYLIRILLDKLK